MELKLQVMEYVIDDSPKTIAMPQGSQPLDVLWRSAGKVVLVVLVNMAEMRMIDRTFIVFATGEPLPNDKALSYFGSVEVFPAASHEMTPDIAYHVFESKPLGEEKTKIVPPEGVE